RRADPLVVAHRDAGPVRKAPVEPARDVPGGRPEGPGELRRVGGQVDLPVEAVVVLLHQVGSPRGVGTFQFAVERVQATQPLRADPGRCAGGQLRGDARLHPEQVLDVPFRQRRDDEPASRLQDDEPLAAQRLQRLPDRGDADAELQGEPFQPQALAGPDAAVEDQLADAGGGLVAQLEARAERPPGSGGGCGQGHVVELPSGPSRGPTPRSSRALTPWFPPRDPFSRGRASVQAMTPSAISGTPKAANPAAPYSMTRPGSLFPPVRLDGSAVAGRGPWSEGDADEDRLVDQLDAERVADASAHLAGERQEVGGLGAARVGEGEGVLGGDARRADGVALAEAGAVDQPGGGRLDPAPVLRVARERDVRAE